jgi:hypothetical protein
MNVFLGYFVWGLILGVPLWLICWRFQLGRYVPMWLRPVRSRPLQLPPQVDALLIRGKRRTGQMGLRR